MRGLAIIFIIVLFGLIGGILFSVQQPFLRDGVYGLVASVVDVAPGSDSTEVQFVVGQGESAGNIAERLERERLVRNAWSFTLLARLRGVDERLEAGVFALRRNMTTSEVLDELLQGRYAGLQVTFPEGWRAAEMASLLATKQNAVPGEEFLSMAGRVEFDYDFLRGIPAGVGLEGYLFPDTYRLPPGITTQQLIDEMLNNFARKFTPEMRQQALDRGLSVHEALTMASIVEREAVVAEERPLIAGVFLNRLALGMPLQADATVQYAKVNSGSQSAVITEFWPKDLTVADLEFDSPYNTYQNTGLPPGPICNPGLDSIRAVLEPANTDYLYFVAKEDGSHVFATNLDEHNENVAKYQLNRGQ